MLELHRYGVQIVYAVDKYVHIFHAVVRGQPFIPLFMEFLPFLIYIRQKRMFYGIWLKKEGGGFGVLPNSVWCNWGRRRAAGFPGGARFWCK
jgi:hypothetical protein